MDKTGRPLVCQMAREAVGTLNGKTTSVVYATHAIHQPATRHQTDLGSRAGRPDAEGNFIPMAQWDPAHWPPHIHPPREARR